MRRVRSAWIALLRWLSFGWWERERLRMRTEEVRSAERYVNQQRATWTANGFRDGVLEIERKYRFGLGSSDRK